MSSPIIEMPGQHCKHPLNSLTIRLVSNKTYRTYLIFEELVLEVKRKKGN